MNPDNLPHGEHKPKAVPFKEAEDVQRLSLIANSASLFITIILLVPAFFRGRESFGAIQLILACALAAISLLPHEFLHAICFKKDVYLYTSFKQGVLFVTGPETMSKGRFVFMSLLPNVVLGLIPYLIGTMFPQHGYLLISGACCIGMGAGDYYNIFNALTQMPKGARTYLHKFNSFWYIP